MGKGIEYDQYILHKKSKEIEQAHKSSPQEEKKLDLGLGVEGSGH